MLDNENGLYAHAPRSIQRATAFKQTLPSRVGVLAERVQIKKRKMPDMGNKKARKAGMKSLRPEARRIFAILKRTLGMVCVSPIKILNLPHSNFRKRNHDFS
jgi:hypothetical protein